MIIKTYEAGKRGEACAALLAEHAPNYGIGKVTVLPIPSTRDGRCLKGSDIPIDNIAESAEEGELIVCYGLPREAAERMEAAGATVYDAGGDESFLERNAELTAECTLGVLMTSSGGRAVGDCSFGIVGYGRIGRHLARLLLFFGASVRVYTSRSEILLELAEYGVDTRMSSGDAPLEGLDVLINTAPAKIFGDESCLPQGLRVIDLASGENFPKEWEVERYPSVPAKMFPISAGRALAEGAVRYLDGLGR